MQLVERHIINKNKQIENLCFNSARLYNFCNYYKRQMHFGNVDKCKEYELSSLFAKYNQEDYRSLPSGSSQQVIKQVYANWSAYYKSLKEYNKNTSKFSGRPRIPKYKDKKGYSICVFTKSQVWIRNGIIKFPKMTNLPPIKTKVKDFQQVRIVPQATCFVIEVVYNKEKQIIDDLKKDKFLLIDLGVNNFATSTNNVGSPPFIINGRPIKSVNQMYNKTQAKLMSYIGNRGTSNRLKKLTHYRNNYIEDKMHKISRHIINFCIANKIGTIVVGKNKFWKDKVNMGKISNQRFCIIPHAIFIQKLQYKGEMVGINVIPEEEHLTSKTDHLAYEKMELKDKYLGKRKKRGLFQSSTGKLINADVNGSIGIGRKVFGDSAVKQIVDGGLAFNPIKLNII